VSVPPPQAGWGWGWARSLWFPLVPVQYGGVSMSLVDVEGTLRAPSTIP
jgi:hypothetical protein